MAREFWIVDEKEVYDAEQDLGLLRGDQIHVIEKAAYDEVLKRLEEIEGSQVSFKEYWQSRFSRCKYWNQKNEEQRHMLTWFTAWSKPK